jgi:hypothetical protein
MVAKCSGYVVYCLKTENPNRPLVLTHHEDGSISVDCLFLKCPFLHKCQLSENSFIKDYLSRLNL